MHPIYYSCSCRSRSAGINKFFQDLSVSEGLKLSFDPFSDRLNSFLSVTGEGLKEAAPAVVGVAAKIVSFVTSLGI